MIDASQTQYMYLPIYSGIPPEYPYLVELELDGYELQPIFNLLYFTENINMYQCFQQSDTPYRTKMYKLMVCFNDVKRAIAFKMRIPNDLRNPSN